MKKLFSKVLDILKHPRGWPLFVFSLFVFYILFACTLTAAIAFAILAPKQTILCYVCYALAAAGLAYFVYTIIYLVPKIKNSTVRAMHRHRFTDNLLNERDRVLGRQTRKKQLRENAESLSRLRPAALSARRNAVCDRHFDEQNEYAL